MGASSVTGVSGYGSAEATSKGPKERNFVGVEKLIGPRVILATQATIGLAGTVSVAFADAAGLDGDAVDFCVFASAPNAVTVTKVVNGVTGHLVSATITGTALDVVDVVLVNVGDAL